VAGQAHGRIVDANSPRISGYALVSAIMRLTPSMLTAGYFAGEYRKTVVGLPACSRKLMNRKAFWCPPLVRPGGVISHATR
jgi:hypothetical protein